jgi:hypothetical protein
VGEIFRMFRPFPDTLLGGGTTKNSHENCAQFAVNTIFQFTDHRRLNYRYRGERETEMSEESRKFQVLIVWNN